MFARGELSMIALVLLVSSACLPAATANTWLENIVDGVTGGPASDVYSFERLYFERGDKSKGSGKLTIGKGNNSVSYFLCGDVGSTDCENMIPGTAGKVAYCYRGSAAPKMEIPDPRGGDHPDQATLSTGISPKANICGCYGVSVLVMIATGRDERGDRSTCLVRSFTSLVRSFTSTIA